MTSASAEPQVRGAIPTVSLGDRMYLAMRYAGIGVQEMADSLGMTRESVGRWINGRGEPKRGTVVAWATLTGVDLEWLEGGVVRHEGLEPPTRCLGVSGRVVRVDFTARRRAA